MGWLSPVGKNGKCACGGTVKNAGTVPLKARPAVAYLFVKCEQCDTGWTDADKGVDYRLYKVNGKWHAKPI